MLANTTGPTQFGRYTITSEIGRGILAIVYRATDEQHQRAVALKILPRGLLLDITFADFFRKTIAQIAAYQHPAIVPIYDYGEFDQQLFIATQLMPGGSVTTRLAAGGALPVEDCARILRQVASAVDGAHAHGLLHLNLQPNNILFDAQDNAFIVDFSLAPLISQIESTNSLTINSPAYMSPEQAMGAALTARTDLYALGAVLFEMLAGRPVYAEPGKPDVMVARAHVADPVPNILQYKPDLPPQCAALFYRALAKKAEARFASAAEMVEAFQAALDSPAAPAPTPAPHPPNPPPQSPTTLPARSNVIWWLLGLGIVLAVGVTAYLFATR